MFTKIWTVAVYLEPLHFRKVVTDHLTMEEAQAECQKIKNQCYQIELHTMDIYGGHAWTTYYNR